MRPFQFMIDIARSSDPQVVKLLSAHPRVEVAAASEEPGIQFEQGSWKRKLVQGSLEREVAGLVELMDNNPLVCADEASVPGADATLALIALGPLARAGLLVEAPTFLTNAPLDEDRLDSFLAREGWNGGVTASDQGLDFGSVYAGTAIAAIQTPQELSEIDDLYEEAFGRSFFVRRDENSQWDTSLVAGKPHAVYRLRIAPDDSTSLLTIQVMADRDGKCGAAQLVHAMNVMAGFEESLGLSGF